jgi:hypothetical protein
MAHIVRVNAGKKGISLPDGNVYDGQVDVTLTDAEYARIHSTLFPSILTDLGSVAPSAPPGIQVVSPGFPFAFDDPGLADGIEVFTPIVGHLLHDAWVEVAEAWDGTTPQCDFGPSTAGYGLLSYQNNGPFPIDEADQDETGNAIGAGFTAQASIVTTLQNGLAAQVESRSLPDGHYGRRLPARIVVAHPFLVWVSQDGSCGGADPGSTRGSAVLYVVTSAPS